jgi:hypothetical protein
VSLCGSTFGTRYLTDAKALEAVLPAGFRLWGEPVVTVEAIYMTGFSWLAGGGYNMFDVKIPVIYASQTEGDVHGTLLMARWESLSDPITTGREELGHNKLFCDIPEVSDFNGRYHTSMSWRGFPLPSYGPKSWWSRKRRRAIRPTAACCHGNTFPPPRAPARNGARRPMPITPR